VKKKKTYFINYNSLCKICQFSYLEDYCKENEIITGLINCENLVYFLDVYIHQPNTKGGNKKTNTVGKVAIIFELIFGLHKTVYQYDDIYIEEYYLYKVVFNYIWDETSENPIAPFNRLAFKISHLIKQNVVNYFGKYLDVDFEINFFDGTGKKYDVCIFDKHKKKLLIVEIQENSSNHSNSVNDKYKQFIVNSNGLIIKYFEEKKMKEDEYECDYECQFYADLLHTCREILISTSAEYRNENLLLEVDILSKKKIKSLKNKLDLLDKDTDEFDIIGSEIIKWNELSKDNSETIKEIEKLYNYKIESFNNPTEDLKIEYNIPLEIVIKNLDININIDEIGIKNSKNDDIFETEKFIIQFSNKINGKYFLSYDSLNEFLVAVNIDEIYNLKMHFIHILLCSQKIYEKYIKIIENYKDSVINKLSSDKTKIKDDIEQKYKKKNDKINKKLKEKNKKLEKENLKLYAEILKLKKESVDSDLENQADESDID
jgi:hypothetical protein